MGLFGKAIRERVQQHKDNSGSRVHDKHINRGCQLCEQAGSCVCGAEGWRDTTW